MTYTKSATTLALIGLLGLSLSACGKSASDNPTAPSVEALNASPAASAPAEATGKKSTRGNLIKELKEPAGQTDQITKKQVVNFTIDAITVDAPCKGQYPQPAENGHFVTLAVTAETTPDLAESSYPKFDVSAHNFQFIGKSGTTYNGSLATTPTYMCQADDEKFPMNGMGPGEKVSAKVLVDVPETHGILVFKPLGALAGWEYKF